MVSNGDPAIARRSVYNSPTKLRLQAAVSRYTGNSSRMRFSVDAHAIGCHLTGNEVYIRNLLNQFARIDSNNEFIAHVAKPGAERQVPAAFQIRRVSANPYRRLGLDLPPHLRRDRPDLIHVQYPGPLFCPVPVVVSVHDVSFLEYPQYFTKFRAAQLRFTVKRTVENAARVLTPSD